MSYLDNFRNRVYINGETEEERYLSQGEENFQQLLSTPNSKKVYLYEEKDNIDKTIYDTIILDQSQTNTTGDDKYMLTSNSNTDIVSGKIIVWNEEEWLVWNKERQTVETNNKFIIKLCNYILKWITKDGIIKEYPCITKVSNMYSDGTNNATYYYVGDGQQSVVIPNNVDTSSFKEDDRIAIGDNIWKITTVNRTTYIKENNIMITMVADEINVALDFTEDGSLIADYNKYPYVENTIPEGNKYITIDGASSVKANATEHYICTLINNDIEMNTTFLYGLSDVTLATITNIVGNEFDIVSNSEGKYGTITLTVTAEDGTIATKDIEVKSFWSF